MIEEFGNELADIMSGIVQRAGKIKDGKTPTFERSSSKIVHPNVFKTKEEAEFFAYKLDGKGVKNAADEKNVVDYVLGDF